MGSPRYVRPITQKLSLRPRLLRPMPNFDVANRSSLPSDPVTLGLLAVNCSTVPPRTDRIISAQDVTQRKGPKTRLP